MGVQNRIVEQAETAVARERLCKRDVTVGYFSDRGNAIEDEVFSVWSVSRIHNENQLPLRDSFPLSIM
jgi:hypothetical protein